MYEKLQAIREKRANGEKGFTLIELLVVVVIIGVLVAIAIPLYLNYKEGAENKSTQSDVRNAAPAVEQYAADNNGSYPTAAAYVNITTLLTDVHVSDVTNSLEYQQNGSGFCIKGANDNDTWYYSSAAGKVTTSTPTGC